MDQTPSWNNKELLCSGLPSRPLPDTRRVLVTGASGYVGGRLVPELLARGYQVRAMVRDNVAQYKERWPMAQIVVADALKREQLTEPLKEIDTAYYLMHSLLKGPKEFESADLEAAVNFRKAAEENKVKRIIYLGGLGDSKSSHSHHLQSRMAVAEELRLGAVPVTILRAAVIIGSGSASYEIMNHLARRLWVVLLPYWVHNRCQPIAIRDVIKYLVGVFEVPETTGEEYDIGGQDVLTYKEMLRRFVRFLNKKRLLISLPLFSISVAAYVISLLTPVPAPIIKCLMEGLKDEVVCRDDRIRKILPFEPLTYEEAIKLAVSREEQDMVDTRWSDAYPRDHAVAIKLHELSERPIYTASHSLLTNKSPSCLFASVCKIGGKEQWYHSNWMWKLRGSADRMLLGVGTARARKSYSRLAVGDVIDFWRIEDLEKNRRLLLRSEMKMPGAGWLEFKIQTADDKHELSVANYFHTTSLLGKVYWYTFIPFHHFILRRLIERIEDQSQME
ncbi:MAG: SDR family oxidoreductase [Thermodesulfobacteriota bacterium]|nr:SDR family oxidoreductase [Thermodesulfobacteriota bacterium]